MVYVNIPYVAENDRIDRGLVIKELQVLNISESAKHDAFDAIFHKRPRGVEFEEVGHAVLLEGALSRLGVPYRQTKESDYKYELQR